MESIFSLIRKYWFNIFRSLVSVWGSAFAIFPYLFGIGSQRKKVTEEYPDPVSSKTDDDLPSKTRGLLENDMKKCTGCQECEKVCPTNAIEVKNELGSSESKNWVAVFNIDYGRCIFCGLCVESCQPQSLVHTKKYEFATDRPDRLIVGFGKGWVSPELRRKWVTMREQEEFL